MNHKICLKKDRCGNMAVGKVPGVLLRAGAFAETLGRELLFKEAQFRLDVYTASCAYANYMSGDSVGSASLGRDSVEELPRWREP